MDFRPCVTKITIVYDIILTLFVSRLTEIRPERLLGNIFVENI
jgi:hypothetical protein